MGPMTPAEIRAAQHLLGYYRVPGFPHPGSFTETLIQCFERADPWNKGRLLLGFPEYRPALAVLSIHGTEKLEEIVRAAEKDRAGE